LNHNNKEERKIRKWPWLAGKVQCCNSIFVSAFWSTVHVVENRWETIHNRAQYGEKPLSGQQSLYPKIWTQNYWYCHIKAEVNFLHISRLVDFSRATHPCAVCTRLFWGSLTRKTRCCAPTTSPAQFYSSCLERKSTNNCRLGKKSATVCQLLL
jgi:hypothetical protein